MRKNYQRKERKSNRKFEVVRGQELLVRVPLPMAEVWAEMQAQVEELTGQAGLQILRAILDNEVTRRDRTTASAESYRRLCPLGKAVGLRGLRWTEDPAGTSSRIWKECGRGVFVSRGIRPTASPGGLSSVSSNRNMMSASSQSGILFSAGHSKSIPVFPPR